MFLDDLSDEDTQLKSIDDNVLEPQKEHLEMQNEVTLNKSSQPNADIEMQISETPQEHIFKNPGKPISKGLKKSQQEIGGYLYVIAKQQLKINVTFQVETGMMTAKGKDILIKYALGVSDKLPENFEVVKVELSKHGRG